MWCNGVSSVSDRVEDGIEYGDRLDHCDGPDSVNLDEGGEACVEKFSAGYKWVCAASKN